MFNNVPEIWLYEAILKLTCLAAAWCQKFFRESWSLTLERFSEKICCQFTSIFTEIAIKQKLNSLVQTRSVKDYVEAHIKICQRAPFKFDVYSAVVVTF